jgi:hypothetical protein
MLPIEIHTHSLGSSLVGSGSSPTMATSLGDMAYPRFYEPVGGTDSDRTFRLALDRLRAVDEEPAYVKRPELLRRGKKAQRPIR